MNRDRHYRACVAVVRAIAPLVPRARRADWLREWQGELWHRLHDPKETLAARELVRLLGRTGGALPHALWLRRDEWRIDSMLQDLKYALRTTLRRPAFAVLVVLILALGIGANTAMFSIVNAILIRPLPYPRSEELVYAFGAFRGSDQAAISPPDFLDYRERNRAFSALAATTVFGGATLTGDDVEPERLETAGVSANYFTALGVTPRLGRTFTPEEEVGQHDVVILSHRLWVRRFAADPNIVGKAATIDGRARTIIGVMPPLLDRTLGAELWTTIAFRTPETSVRRFHFLRAIGRLRPGVTIAEAQRQLDEIARDLAGMYPENESWRLRLEPYRDVVVGSAGTALLVLLGSVALVLLIACGNVAGLLLARATARTGEIAVRTALGASRGRLVRQLLTESLLMAGAAGVVGLGLAVLVVRGVKIVAEGILPRLAEVGVDGAALVFTAGLAIATSIIFGLAPALQAARADLGQAMKSLGRASASRRGVRARDALIVAQVAVSLTLLVGAGLLMRSLWELQRVDVGFSAERLLAVRPSPPEAKYTTREQLRQFWLEALDRVSAIPGVESAAATGMLPLRGGGDTYFHLEGRSSDADRRNAQVNVISDRYFETMAIPIVSGRSFAAAETPEGPRAVILNRSLAERLFEGRSPLGNRLVVDFGEPVVVEIVGVAGDVRAFGGANDSPDIMYFSLRQNGVGFSIGFLRLAIRTRAEPTAIIPLVRTAIREIDPVVPVTNPETMEEILSDSVSQPRFRARLLGGFAGVALVLALVGLYGVLGYSVSQRARELGVRMALGATRAEVFMLVVRQGMMLVSVGVALGIALSLAATRILERLLFGVGATDLSVFAAVSAMLVAAGLAACLAPARRATSVDPIAVLRAES
jgi:putative ABC transport system permease protein